MGSPDDRGEVRGSQGALGLQEQQQTERKPASASQRQERPQRLVCSGYSLQVTGSECWCKRELQKSIWKWIWSDTKKSYPAGLTWSFKCQELSVSVWHVTADFTLYWICPYLLVRIYQPTLLLLAGWDGVHDSAAGCGEICACSCYFCFDSSVI